ncbi:MAG: DNA mismatch repair endonuclease MutL, partial [Kiritimatiellia bacterium]
ADEGTEVLVSPGGEIEVRPAGCPPGTSVEVRGLFYNVPARRKFLRSHRTELAHLRRAFTVQSLSRPDTASALTIDGRETYRLPAVEAAGERIRDIFGADFFNTLAGIDYSAGDVTVRGFVTVPPAARSDRNEQYIFVNSRSAGAPLLGYALREAYRSLLPEGRYPSVFLFIGLNPSTVDVNIHPAKREVRFRQGSLVRDAVIAGIRQVLGNRTVVHTLGHLPGKPESLQAGGGRLAIEDLPVTRTFRYPGLRRAPEASGQPAGQPGRVEESGASLWSNCRVLGQIGGLFVILETEDGMVIMDPHAAHERVLYDRFMRRISEGNIETQPLLMPKTVELAAGDALGVENNLEAIRGMGIGIAPFGENTFAVDALPEHFQDAPVQPLIVEIASELENSGPSAAAGPRLREQIARAACRAAVKAHDRLKLEEIERLVVDLAGTDMPYTCPHGRPTVIFTSFEELRRKFGRT